MSDNPTPEELEDQDGEPLPDREAMSVITPPGAEVDVELPTGDPWQANVDDS